MIQNDTHFVSFLGFHTISQSHKTYSNWFALGGSQVAQFTQILPGSPVWGIRHRSCWQTYMRSEKLRSTPGKNGSMSRELSQHVMGMIEKLQDMSVTFQCYIFIIKYTVSILYIYISFQFHFNVTGTEMWFGDTGDHGNLLLKLTNTAAALLWVGWNEKTPSKTLAMNGYIYIW